MVGSARARPRRAASPWVLVIVAVAVVAVVAAAWAAVRAPFSVAGPTSAGPTSAGPTSAGPTSAGPTSAGLTSAVASPTPTPTPPDVLAGWSLEQKVGQLFVVGLDLTAPQAVSSDAVRADHVGNVFLHGRTTAGAAGVRAQVAGFTALVSSDTTHGEPMLVAVDQEGGQVQSLQGSGFSRIPAATAQAGVAPDTLRAQATTWGGELAAVGVDLDLAPVMDLVPAATATQNPPIGRLHRSYGFTADSVTTHAEAFSAGMQASGVAVAVKHFPGLGRVTANTDTTAGVTDTVTGRDDPSVEVFHSGIRAGVDAVLMSTAVYTLIDPTAPAAFSPTVVTGLLRGDLGFDGVVITDDLSAATQVAAWSPADRAVLAISAGCDLVLVSKDPTVTHAMVAAVVAKAQADPAFAAQVDVAARRVLALKARLAA